MKSIWVLLTIIGAFIALLAAYGINGIWLPGRSHSGPLPQLTSEEKDLADRLRRHIEDIASEPHNTLHPDALERSAKAVEAAFTEAGFAPHSQVYTADRVAVRNIWVTVEPQDSKDSETLVVGGHYDSAGNAPGAGDNGSGAAGVIELARMFKNNRPKRTRLIFVAFVNEEAPYWGSADQGALRFADLLLGGGEKIRGMLSLETIAWFDDRPGSQKYPFPFNLIYPDTGDFLAFVAMPGSRAFLHEVLGTFRRLAPVPTIGGVAPSFFDGIAWSDHTPFANKGIPALMITDTALFRYPHYHRPSDTPDKVNVEMLARVIVGLERVLQELAPQ